MPEKLPWMVAGRPIVRPACWISSTASPSAVPGLRLNDSVTDGNCDWWFTESAVVDGARLAKAPSGTMGPVGVRTWTCSSTSGLCAKAGAASITTWY